MTWLIALGVWILVSLTIGWGVSYWFRRLRGDFDNK